MGRWWTSFVLLCLGSLALSSSKIPNQVLELNEKFLEVKNEGLWLIAFYAPWCGHCKRLHPIWEHVGHGLEDTKIRVGRIDCTRFTTVASALDVHGFPTIKFFRHGVVYSYEGDRTKEAIMNFALKTLGPEVRKIEGADQKAFEKVHKQHSKDVYFLLISEAFDADTQLKDDYYEAAKTIFTKTYLYEVEETILPPNVTYSNLPSIVCIKDASLFEFDPAGDQTLIEWIDAQRWPIFPEITYATFYDIGTCCDKLLVMATLELAYKNDKNHPVANFWRLVERTAKIQGPQLSRQFQFGWSNGNEMASSVVLGAVPVPGLLVVNVSSYQFYLPEDSPSHMTEESIVLFLERISSGQKLPLGGRGVIQRIKRMFYEFFTAIYSMFATQPLLTSCLFGLPIGILSVICYSLCSADFSVDQDEVYPDSEESEAEDHEKLE